MTSESIFKRVVNSLNSQQESKHVCQNNISTVQNQTVGTTAAGSSQSNVSRILNNQKAEKDICHI